MSDVTVREFIEEFDSKCFDIAGFILLDNAVGDRFARQAMHILDQRIEPHRAGLMNQDAAIPPRPSRLRDGWLSSGITIGASEPGSSFWLCVPTNNRIARDPEDHFSSGQIGDNFLVIFLLADSGGSGIQTNEANQRKEITRPKKPPQQHNCITLPHSGLRRTHRRQHGTNMGAGFEICALFCKMGAASEVRRSEWDS